MRKVGQVTYCGENYGSVLQCYATQFILSKKGYECVLLKRTEKGIGRILQSLEFRLDRWYKYFRYYRYKKKFDTMLGFSGKASGMNEESIIKTHEFIDRNIEKKAASYTQLRKLARKNEYIAFFSGSDQIWSATWFIKNKMWFLRFAPKEKRVAWMPSFGSDVLAEYNISSYRKYISEYEHLSSREKRGAEIITELTGREAAALADPVVLLSPDEWRAFASERKKDEKYIVLFFLDNPSKEAIEMANRIQEDTGYKAVVFCYEHDLSGKMDCEGGGPQDFISIIHNAEFLLTDSFHACMFSVIFKVPFYVFYRNTKYVSKQSSRIDNLLDSYKMKQRLIESVRDINKQDYEMDREYIDSVLSKERDRVLQYLDRVLDKYESKRTVK